MDLELGKLLFSDIEDEKIKAELEHVLQDSLQRASNAINLTLSSAENIGQYHPRDISYSSADASHAGAVIFGGLLIMAFFAGFFVYMILRGMRGQLDLDMDTLKGGAPRNMLAFKNPFKACPRQEPASLSVPTHVSYGNNSDMSPGHSDMVISDDASDAGSVNIPI